MSRSVVLRCVAFLPLAALAGCASQQSQRYASAGSHSTSSGLFPQRIYGPASPRVADGDNIPSGGGKYHVGKPYQIAGKTYYPSEKPVVQTGTASWYGSDFHGRRTANGEIFNRYSVTAAHPTMPLPSYARVTNLANAHSMIVRVNDRGPYHGGRVMDVSQRVAEALDFQSAGTARVKVEWIARANLAGDNDSTLLATLRNDGAPAQLAGYETPASTMTASAEEEAPAPASKVARAEKRKLSDEITRLASREPTRADDAPMAYTETRQRDKAHDRADETVVSSTHRDEASTPSKPTPLDEPVAGERGRARAATSSQTKSATDAVVPPAGIPLPPSRKARGKEARADDAIQGAVY